MRRRLFVALLGFALAAPAWAESPAAETNGPAASARPKRSKKSPRARRPAENPTRPVNITAQLFEVKPESQQAIWKGNVVVDRDDMRITCDMLTARYDDAKKLKSLVCVGRVHMIQRPSEPGKPEREAWGDRAVFENARSTLTLTGDPRAREGANTMRGTKVTYHVDEDRLQVENAVMVLDSGPEKPGARGSGARDAGEGESR